MGRSILLGLEFLVAADIIRTVAVTATGQKVLVLGGIVLIPTFLSFSLQLEMTGAWPWQKRPSAPPEGAGGGIRRYVARVGSSVQPGLSTECRYRSIRCNITSLSSPSATVAVM
ncbi:MAG: putative rane protein [Mycobacterium sp.]|nr:putative rane protein [Mycobacterium sp.]